MPTTVCIAQEYVPEYRRPFFNELRTRLAEDGVRLVVAAGNPNKDQAMRSDDTGGFADVFVRQTERSIAGRRVTVRRLPPETRNCDLLILEQARRNLDVYRLLLPRKLQSPPRTALWGHGRDFTQSPSALERRISVALLRRAWHFFGYTQVSSEAAESAGVPPAHITVVNNTIDTRALRVDLATVPNEAVAELADHLALEGRTALFMGGLDESKRIAFLLEAAAAAHRIDARFRLVIAGDGALRPAVQEAARLRPELIYVGAVAGHRRALMLKLADVVAMPGRVGLIAVECLVAGTPLITTAWPFHAPEFSYLDPGVTAIITPDDVQSYASGLVDILNLESRRAEMKLACLTASRAFSVEAMAANFRLGIHAALSREV